MRLLILLLLLCIALFFEGSLITTPFFLSLLIISAISRFNHWFAYSASFIGGLYLDIAHVGVLGMTGLIFIFFLLIISLYERKFEIHTFQFAGFASFIGSLVYLKIFQHEFIVMQSIITTGITLFLFVFFKERKVRKSYGEL